HRLPGRNPHAAAQSHSAEEFVHRRRVLGRERGARAEAARKQCARSLQAARRRQDQAAHLGALSLGRRRQGDPRADGSHRDRQARGDDGMSAGAAIVAAWLVWLVTWVMAAGWSARTASHHDLGAESPSRVLTLAALVVMIASYYPVGFA